MDEIEKLMQDLKDPHKSWEETQKIAQALAEIGEPAVPALVELMLSIVGVGVYTKARDILAEIGEPAVPALIEVLDDKEEKSVNKGQAALALNRIGDPSAVPSLIRALKDSNKHVRRFSIEALGKIGDAAAIPALMEALVNYNRDNEMGTDMSIANALADIGKPAIPALVREINDERQRFFSAIALERIIERIETIEDADEIKDMIHASYNALPKRDMCIESRMMMAKGMKAISDKKNRLTPKRDLRLRKKPGSERNRGKIYQRMQRITC